jgi:2-hydroxychromene-2-carboxylate isomerase
MGAAAAGPPPPSGERPVFFYDLGSPECYLAAERVNDVLGLVPVWQPVHAGALGLDLDADALDRGEVERLAAERSLLPLRWPPVSPVDAPFAARAAVFAQASGRAVAFSLAAFRQAFAAGRDLRVPDHVLVAAAACELHPRALLKGAESGVVERRLAAAHAQASELGVAKLPAVALGPRVWTGDAGLDEAGSATRAGARGAPTA